MHTKQNYLQFLVGFVSFVLIVFQAVGRADWQHKSILVLDDTGPGPAPALLDT